MQCSTLNMQVGLNIGDREYFKKAQETRDFVFSDYLFGKTNGRPMMMAAYPVSAINRRRMPSSSPASTSTGCRRS